MFTILRVYSDCSTVTETTDNIIRALSACAIYLEDPDCISVKIWRTKDGTFILDYYRE